MQPDSLHLLNIVFAFVIETGPSKPRFGKSSRSLLGPATLCIFFVFKILEIKSHFLVPEKVQVRAYNAEPGITVSLQEYNDTG